MIDAKEAREKVNAIEIARNKKEQETVEEKIIEAVEKGKSSCWLHLWISEETEEWLTNLGYEVWRDYAECNDVEVKW